MQHNSSSFLIRCATARHTAPMAVWTTITPADIDCLPNGHKSYDGIKKEMCNLYEGN